jgi:hypothetical protein
MTEQTLAFDWNGLTLVGTLHLPDEDGPHPVVVMIQGSGPSDRTSNGYFPPIRDAFLTRGIGTFAFDKPGCGESTGDWKDYALEARADQVVNALNAVRYLPTVAEDLIGIWGQSQGGWLVQMLASRLDNLAFAIANSGPSINLPDQDLYNCEHSMRAGGSSEDDIELALEFVTNIHTAARNGLPYETVDAELLAAARHQPWYGDTSIDSDADWRLICQFVTEGYEPLEALRHIRPPYLAIYGGRDVLLPPWQSAKETGESLQQAENPDATVVVFPEGNHRIQDMPSGRLVTGYLDLLTDWTASHIASHPRP